MKKLISLLLAFAAVCSLCPALADAADYVGEYYLDMVFINESFDIFAEALGISYRLSLNEDGTAWTSIAMGDGNAAITDGTWTMEDKTTTAEWRWNAGDDIITFFPGSGEEPVQFISDEYYGLWLDMNGVLALLDDPTIQQMSIRKSYGLFSFDWSAVKPAPHEVIAAESEDAFWGDYGLIAVVLNGELFPIKNGPDAAIDITPGEVYMDAYSNDDNDIYGYYEGTSALTEDGKLSVNDGEYMLELMSDGRLSVAFPMDEKITLTEDGGLTINGFDFLLRTNENGLISESYPMEEEGVLRLLFERFFADEEIE